MTIVDELRKLQAGRTQVAFSALLGIRQSNLSEMLSGKRPVSFHVAQVLCAQYPTHAKKIASLFLEQTITRRAKANDCAA